MASRSPARDPVDRRPARIPESEQPGDLVERLARGIVEGLSEDAVLAVALDRDDHRVAPRHEEDRERRGEIRLFEPCGVQMRLEVVHTDVRDVDGEREGLGCAHSYEERAGEPGAVTGRDRVEVGELAARLDERLRDDSRDELHVSAARDLRDDATETRVEVDLARHHRRSDEPSVVHDGGRGLVAARLQPEDLHRAIIGRCAPDVGSLRNATSIAHLLMFRAHPRCRRCAPTTDADSRRWSRRRWSLPTP